MAAMNGTTTGSAAPGAQMAALASNQVIDAMRKQQPTGRGVHQVGI